jgi:ribosomal protein S18 acetylase RimI-like enzyme
MNVAIEKYIDKMHRSQVADIWKSVFKYKDERNNPLLLIDKKIAVNDDLFFVAVEERKVVGTIMAGYDGHRGWIYSLAVIPDKRKIQIGTKLLKYAENALKKRGCVKINLQILKENEAVKSFYLKNGYNVEERINLGKQIDENI